MYGLFESGKAPALSIRRFAPRSGAWLLGTAVLALALLGAARAGAWGERSVQSSIVVLTLERDGTAEVRHELVVDVRGDRLKALSLQGIDRDAVPLADATLVRTDGSRATSLPLALELGVEADVANLRLPLKQGMSGRTFHVHFGYRTELRERGLLRSLPGESSVELAWAGPRFENGVDSATLILRAPAGATPPAAIEDANYGMVVSTLRRSAVQDELELVRAHVASGEAVTWRVRLDAALFQRATVSAANEEPEAPPLVAEPRARARVTGRSAALGLAGAALFGALYGLLVWLKSHWSARAAALSGSASRALLPWPLAARVATSALGFGSAAALVMLWEQPNAAAVLLVLALLSASQRGVEVVQEPRGPGSWKPLGNEAYAEQPAPALPGAWLDASKPAGFALLTLALVAWGSAAATLYTTSPYAGACALIGSAALLPIFCTGRAAELPLDGLRHSRRFFRELSRRLKKQADLQLTLLGRFADADGQMDELRLSLQPARSLPGLLGLEVAIELQHGLGSASASPVLLLRAADGSPFYRAMPRELTWTRGRSAEERVSLIHPRLPTLGVCETLIRQLLTLVAGPQPEPAGKPQKSAARSAGSSLSTAKAATSASPAQAT